MSKNRDFSIIDFWGFGENMGFYLIFAKNQIDHRILRKKLRHFKKKKIFISTDFWPFWGQNKILVDRKLPWFFNFRPQNMAFGLIFVKNWYDHRILRKKLGHFKKKRIFFRPIFGHFQVKIPKNT